MQRHALADGAGSREPSRAKKSLAKIWVVAIKGSLERGHRDIPSVASGRDIGPRARRDAGMPRLQKPFARYPASWDLAPVKLASRAQRRN